MRDGVQKLTTWQAARGFADSFTLTSLVTYAFFPLLLPAVAGGASGNVVLTWLAGLGCNALAGWLASWSEREVRKLLSGDTAQEQVLIEQLAADLQSHLARDEALRVDFENLLDQTEGILTAVNALAFQSDAQTRLIDAIRVDIRQSNLIQGRLHQKLVRQLSEAEARITLLIASEGSFIREEVRLQAAKTHAHLDILPAMHAEQSSMREMLGLILRRLPQEETPAANSNSGAQGAVDAQIDIARKLVQDGHFVAARKILIGLQAQPDENEMTQESRARIANLLGCCVLSTDDLKGAQSYFGEAIKLAPNNVSMLANGAMVREQDQPTSRQLLREILHSSLTNTHNQALCTLLNQSRFQPRHTRLHTLRPAQVFR
jgi:hypothetical protein